jgi:hypothetical protein
MKALVVIREQNLGLQELSYIAQITSTSIDRLETILRRDGIYRTGKYEVRFVTPGIYSDEEFRTRLEPK